jgi:hypothetical protein
VYTQYSLLLDGSHPGAAGVDVAVAVAVGVAAASCDGACGPSVPVVSVCSRSLSFPFVAGAPNAAGGLARFDSGGDGLAKTLVGAAPWRLTLKVRVPVSLEAVRGSLLAPIGVWPAAIPAYRATLSAMTRTAAWKGRRETSFAPASGRILLRGGRFFCGGSWSHQALEG